jgi:hypothetical protein
VLKKRKVEDHSDFILGPVSPKEYKDTVAELNGSRTNRVFEFFKVAVPERIGFAKHHEAAKRKAAALTAADADAGERRRALLQQRKLAGKPRLQLQPPPPSKGRPGRSVVTDRRIHPRPPREPGLWTSRPASSEP